MERPEPATIAWYEAAIPDTSLAVRGQMFAHPCAFVNGNMFFGTFAQSVIVRLGERRTAELAAGGPGRVFEPMAARPWREYLQLDRDAIGSAQLATLAAEGLTYAAQLPPKSAKDRPAAKAMKPAKPAKLPAKAAKLPAKPAKLPAKPAKLPAKPAKLPAKPAKLPAKPAKLPAKRPTKKVARRAKR